eukprot:COSAG02_NODE_7157_length_3137_cov_1.833169_2_plen_302_part_00
MSVSRKEGDDRHESGRIERELVDRLLHAPRNTNAGKQVAVEKFSASAGTVLTPLAAPSRTTAKTKPSPPDIYPQARYLGWRFVQPFGERTLAHPPATQSSSRMTLRPVAGRRRCALLMHHEQRVRGSAMAHRRSCRSTCKPSAVAARQFQAQTAREMTTLMTNDDWRGVPEKSLFSAHAPQVHGRPGYGLGYPPTVFRPQRICTQHRQAADCGEDTCLNVPNVVDIEAAGIKPLPETEQRKALKQRLQNLASQAESFRTFEASMLGAVAGDWADMEHEEETANPLVRLPSIGDRNGHCDAP